MSGSADLPPPRRPLFFPVVIAAVLLSVIGMSAGLGLAAWHRNRSAAAPPATSTTAEPCRPETQEMGQRYGSTGVLRVALELRTRSSTVWICQDDAGRLYYHANRGGTEGPWVEGQTALFLTDVRRAGDGYTVTAHDGTTFSVNSRRLLIVHESGAAETQDAVG